MSKLIKINNISLLFILFTFSNISVGQNFHSTVNRVYNFDPTKLKGNQIVTMSAKLDSVWNMVKSDTTTYLKELRIELSDTTHKPFFYFDGCNLLMSLSNTKSDLKLISKAILLCDIGAINNFNYFSIGMSLSFNQINTLPIVEQILKQKKFNPFIVQHAMYWEKELCMVYLLYPLDDQMYVDKIIPLFASANNDSKLSILSFLWYTCTCQGDNFIKKCCEDKTLDKKIRKHANYLNEQNNITSVDNKTNYDELVNKRKDLLMRIGDEALVDFIQQTREIKKEYKCH